MRNLRSDRFGTLAAILGVGLGVATVDVVLILDVTTQRVEAATLGEQPAYPWARPRRSGSNPLRAGGAAVEPRDAKRETHEDYEVMRSAVRLGSLSAFLVGALIVFFTFGVVVERRKREVALLRSLARAPPGRSPRIFVREAVVIGAAGGLFGYLASMPMAVFAAAFGITTTGRSRLPALHLVYPRRDMILVAIVGAVVALLGVRAAPPREVLRLDVAKTLRPRFLEEGSDVARRARGIMLIALPFMVLVYTLLRPFLPAGAPLAHLLRGGGGPRLRRVPRDARARPRRSWSASAACSCASSRAPPPAERLLTQRRIEHMGRELSWSVSGVMLTFALLLALHIATNGLKREVAKWRRERGGALRLRDRPRRGPGGPGRRRPAAPASSRVHFFRPHALAQRGARRGLERAPPHGRAHGPARSRGDGPRASARARCCSRG